MAWLDNILSPLFRITGDPVSSFFFGVFLLAVISALLGEITIALAYLANRRHYDRLNQMVIQQHNLSVFAAREGDKESFRAINKLANDVFGRLFFAQIALGMGSLWPVFFALAFLQGRFASIRFPLPMLPWTVGYGFIFLLFYVLARLVFNRVKYKLPGLHRLKRDLDKARAQVKAMEKELE